MVTKALPNVPKLTPTPFPDPFFLV